MAGWCAPYRRQPLEQQEQFQRYVELEPDDARGLVVDDRTGSARVR